MPDKERLIELAWLSYQRDVIPRNAPEVQVTESRRAFYAGAQALFHTIINILEPGSEPTDNDLQTMTLIQQELKRFGDQVKAGVK
jgi:hypothetical protein